MVQYWNSSKDRAPCRITKTAMPIPPEAEQARIAAEIERRLSVAEGIDTKMKADMNRAARLRRAVLQKALCFGSDK